MTWASIEENPRGLAFAFHAQIKRLLEFAGAQRDHCSD
jgi:hypothetical protein